MIAYCPHGPHENCGCRKPEPGLLLQIAAATGLPIASAPCVGDSLRDLVAARSAGCRPVLVRTGKGRETEARLDEPGAPSRVPVFDDLRGFVGELLSGSWR